MKTSILGELHTWMPKSLSCATLRSNSSLQSPVGTVEARTLVVLLRSSWIPVWIQDSVTQTPLKDIDCRIPVAVLKMTATAAMKRSDGQIQADFRLHSARTAILRRIICGQSLYETCWVFSMHRTRIYPGGPSTTACYTLGYSPPAPPPDFSTIFRTIGSDVKAVGCGERVSTMPET